MRTELSLIIVIVLSCLLIIAAVLGYRARRIGPEAMTISNNEALASAMVSLDAMRLAFVSAAAVAQNASRSILNATHALKTLNTLLPPDSERDADYFREQYEKSIQPPKERQ